MCILMCIHIKVEEYIKLLDCIYCECVRQWPGYFIMGLISMALILILQRCKTMLSVIYLIISVSKSWSIWGPVH